MKTEGTSSGALETWVVRLASSDRMAVAALRLTPGLEVREAADGIWLRLRVDLDAGAQLFGAVPALERFLLGPDGTLRHPRGEVPRGRLPDAGWSSVADWCPVEVSAIAPPVPQSPVRAALRLRRGGTPQAAVALLTGLAGWGKYAEAAPLLRLQPLRFAASAAEGQVLLLGEMLPPLPGTRFVAPATDVLVPAGFEWTPAIDAAALRQIAGARPGDIVWWREKEGVAVLDEALFVPATRAGVRLTMAGNS